MPVKKILSSTIKIAAIVVSVVLVCSIVILFVLFFIDGKPSDTLIAESVSPTGEYHLKAYRTNPGATVDYTVKVYLADGSKEKLIYKKYHDREVEIIWLDEETVEINGISLNIVKNEKYKD